MILMMRLQNTEALQIFLSPYIIQPVADEPFTFETELDDLPKEKLKCTYATSLCD